MGDWSRPHRSKPFPAKYAGTCGGCGWEIEPGDTIVMVEGSAVHDDEECVAKA